VTAGARRETYVFRRGVWRLAVHISSDGSLPRPGPDFHSENISPQYHFGPAKPGPEKYEQRCGGDLQRGPGRSGRQQDASVPWRVANYRPQPVQAELELEVMVKQGRSRASRRKPLSLPGPVKFPSYRNKAKEEIDGSRCPWRVRPSFLS